MRNPADKAFITENSHGNHIMFMTNRDHTSIAIIAAAKDAETLFAVAASMGMRVYGKKEAGNVNNYDA